MGGKKINAVGMGNTEAARVAGPLRMGEAYVGESLLKNGSLAGGIH